MQYVVIKAEQTHHINVLKLRQLYVKLRNVLRVIFRWTFLSPVYHLFSSTKRHTASTQSVKFDTIPSDTTTCSKSLFRDPPASLNRLTPNHKALQQVNKRFLFTGTHYNALCKFHTLSKENLLVTVRCDVRRQKADDMTNMDE